MGSMRARSCYVVNVPDRATRTSEGPPRRADGERTHLAILQTAARVASVEGLHGLSLGRLAQELGVSKSGLFKHFGSKEQLQLETIETAWSIVGEEVVGPALAVPAGIGRLRALVEGFFSYVERGVFPGGCFFSNLLAEVDARSGPIHDVAVAKERAWGGLIADVAHEAQRLGDISAEVDVEQLVFELRSFMELANYHFVLYRQADALARGRAAVGAILERSL